jgi:hypothetical protein
MRHPSVLDETRVEIASFTDISSGSASELLWSTASRPFRCSDLASLVDCRDRDAPRENELLLVPTRKILPDLPTALDRIRRLCYISYARSKSCAGSMPSNTTSIGFPSGRVGGGVIGRDHLTMH